VGSTQREWWRRSCSSSLFRPAVSPSDWSNQPPRKESVKQAIGSRNSQLLTQARYLAVISLRNETDPGTWRMSHRILMSWSARICDPTSSVQALPNARRSRYRLLCIWNGRRTDVRPISSLSLVVSGCYAHVDVLCRMSQVMSRTISAEISASSERIAQYLNGTFENATESRANICLLYRLLVVIRDEVCFRLFL
jgi:hypothetical protein